MISLKLKGDETHAFYTLQIPTVRQPKNVIFMSMFGICIFMEENGTLVAEIV